MALENFHYTAEDGTKLVLPKFSSVKSGIIRKLRKEGELEVLYGVLEAMADEATLAQTDELSAPELVKMFRAWQEDAGVTAGESSASSTS